MNDDKHRKDMDRGVRAEALMRDPLIQEAFDTLEKEFVSAWKQTAITDAAARENLRDDLAIQRVQQGNVMRNINITEQEIDNFLATEEGETLTQPEYRVVQALLSTGRNEDAVTVAADSESRTFWPPAPLPPRSPTMHASPKYGSSASALITARTTSPPPLALAPKRLGLRAAALVTTTLP